MTRPSRVMMPTQYVIAVELLRVATAASDWLYTILISPGGAGKPSRETAGLLIAIECGRDQSYN